MTCMITVVKQNMHMDTKIYIMNTKDSAQFIVDHRLHQCKHKGVQSSVAQG